MKRQGLLLIVLVVFWLATFAPGVDPGAIWTWTQVLLLAFAWWFPAACLGRFLEAFRDVTRTEACRCQWCQGKDG